MEEKEDVYKQDLRIGRKDHVKLFLSPKHDSCPLFPPPTFYLHNKQVQGYSELLRNVRRSSYVDLLFGRFVKKNHLSNIIK